MWTSQLFQTGQLSQHENRFYTLEEDKRHVTVHMPAPCADGHLGHYRIGTVGSFQHGEGTMRAAAKTCQQLVQTGLYVNTVLEELAACSITTTRQER